MIRPTWISYIKVACRLVLGASKIDRGIVELPWRRPLRGDLIGGVFLEQPLGGSDCAELCLIWLIDLLQRFG